MFKEYGVNTVQSMLESNELTLNTLNTEGWKGHVYFNWQLIPEKPYFLKSMENLISGKLPVYYRFI